MYKLSHEAAALIRMYRIRAHAPIAAAAVDLGPATIILVAAVYCGTYLV